VCGRRGHITYAPDEPELRAQLAAQAASGEAWQCLRCGAFVPGPPSASGPAAQAPFVARGRQIRSHLILKFFAVERFLRGVAAGVVSYFLWKYRHSQVSLQKAFNHELPVFKSFFRQLGFNIDHSKLVVLVKHALTLSSHAITLFAFAAAAYAAIELIEAVGLWLAKRWGEYFAMVATSFGLPVEIYDLTRKVTVTASLLFAVNLALVLYLAFTKRLFGIRGGKRAYHEMLWEESVLEAATEAVARQPGTPVAPPGEAAAAQRATLMAAAPAEAAAPAGTDSHRAGS
jgi:uncharacterized membrane protein (DUF2068 family)